MPQRVKLMDSWGGWAWNANRERTLLRGTVGEFIVDVQHIGSTAVPGLIARPTVDLILGTRHWPWGRSLDRRLKSIGYELYEMPDLKRRVYSKAIRELSRGIELQIVEAQSHYWNERLLFRDLLRDQPEAAQAYAQRKLALADEHSRDLAAYQAGKDEFIQDFLHQSRDH